jgi:polyisoprenoid-binding protein YceI
VPQAEAVVAHYALDKRSSRFVVNVFAGGMLSKLGHNPTIAIRDFTGEATLDSAAPQRSSLRVQVRADSLEVTDEISSKDRKEMESAMKEKVLEISQFSTITFESIDASANQLGENRYQVTINGNLALHGSTRSLPLTAQVTVAGDTLRASGAFSILQSDYGITLVSAAGGTLKAKDELKFSFDIVARKQE